MIKGIRTGNTDGWQVKSGCGVRRVIGRRVQDMEASQTDYRILAADDEEELLDILELYLEREGIGIR